MPLAFHLLDLALGECLRSPVATVGAEHLRAVLVERLLAEGAAILEPGPRAGEGRLVTLRDDIVRRERVTVPPTTDAAERRARHPDLRVQAPERLALDLHVRGALSRPARDGGRALLERLERLTSGATDALLVACDRRSYDALRRDPSTASLPPREARLAALCAVILPPSVALADAPMPMVSQVRGGRTYVATAAVTPMVFGVQRVVALLQLRAAGRAREPRSRVVQLEVFA